MATNIKCPNCSHVFDVEDVLSLEVENKLKQEFDQKLQESNARISLEKKKLEEEQRNFEEKKKKGE